MRAFCLIRFGGIAIVLLLGLRAGLAGQDRKFDKLADADRKVLGEQFKRDVWPLLLREGKDGCIGCHMTGKGGTALRFSGDADKDFRMLVREGFFLKDDPGSLLSRIEDTNKKRRMPPGKLPRWNDADKKTLGDLVEAIQKKQKS
jgi:hypothetical protein